MGRRRSVVWRSVPAGIVALYVALRSFLAASVCRQVLSTNGNLHRDCGTHGRMFDPFDLADVANDEQMRSLIQLRDLEKVRRPPELWRVLTQRHNKTKCKETVRYIDQ